MWTWRQSTGELFHGPHCVARGYSGRDWGKNNPSAQTAPGIGPIPCGRWRMTALYDSTRVGPAAIKLDALDVREGDDVHQPTHRAAFRIHGDSVTMPGTASHGCIILPRAIRRQMWASGDHELEVIP